MRLYDPRIGRVFLVRDRLGIKPLYVARLQFETGGTLLFASEIRALLATGLVDRKASAAGIESFLWNGFVAGPETIVQGINRIDPGSWLEIDLVTCKTKTHRYWQLPGYEVDRSLGVDQLRAELLEATHLHLVSDVPLGVFLSGGVDSSAISALAAQSAGPGLRTFNVAFDDPDYDESAHARRVAEELGTEHSELRLTEDIFRAHLDDALSCLDQPTFDAINTYFVSRAVREAGITVALAGTGGDELFGGYATFADIPRVRRAAHVAARMPGALRRLAGQFATRLAFGSPGEVRPQMRWAKLEHMLAHSGRLELYQLSYALFVPEFLDELHNGHAPNATYFGLPTERANQLSEWTRNEPGSARDFDARVGLLYRRPSLARHRRRQHGRIARGPRAPARSPDRRDILASRSVPPLPAITRKTAAARLGSRRLFTELLRTTQIGLRVAAGRLVPPGTWNACWCRPVQPRNVPCGGARSEHGRAALEGI